MIIIRKIKAKFNKRLFKNSISSRKNILDIKFTSMNVINVDL